MSNFLNYNVEIFPIATGDDREQFTIDNTQFIQGAGDKYMLVNFNVHYDILQPDQTNAKIMLFDINADTNSDNQSTLGEDIKRGDIIRITEQTQTGQIAIFTGYIESVDTMFSSDEQFIILNCPSPVKQLTQQYAIRTVENGSSYSIDINNFTQWKIFQNTTIAGMMDIITQGTILELAHDSELTGGLVYKFVEATGTLQGTLNLNSSCWAWIQPTTTKLDAINTVIYPYQYMTWIDQFGTLIMSPLSTRNQAAPEYNFTVTKNVINANDDFISAAGKVTPCLSIATKQSLTANKYVTTIANAGFEVSPLISVQDISGSGRNSSSNNVQTAQQIFSRQQDLLLTGYYTQQIIDIHSIKNEMLTDPILMNLYAKTKGSNPYLSSTNSQAGQIRTTTGQNLINGVLQLFGGRALSESLVNDTLVLVTSERGYTAGLEFPLGKMITVDTAGRLDEVGVDSFLCTMVDLVYAESRDGGWDATLILKAIKPYTHIFLWDE